MSQTMHEDMGSVDYLHDYMVLSFLLETSMYSINSMYT